MQQTYIEMVLDTGPLPTHRSPESFIIKMSYTRTCPLSMIWYYGQWPQLGIPKEFESPCSTQTRLSGQSDKVDLINTFNCHFNECLINKAILAA